MCTSTECFIAENEILPHIVAKGARAGLYLLRKAHVLRTFESSSKSAAHVVI